MKPRPWWEDTDDAERLVHADALTAKGDPRGEFIVLQCTEPSSPRVAELWNAHQLTWLTELGLPRYNWQPKRAGLSSVLFPSKSGLESWTAEFQRGFLAKLWAPHLRPSLEKGLLEGGQQLRLLELDTWDVDDVIERAQQFQLETLGLSGATGAKHKQLDALFASPVFERLAEFSFNVGTDDAEFRAEIILRGAGQRAPRLTRLTLTGALTNAPLRLITKLEWTKRLTHLDVSSRDATEEIPALLAHLPKLEVLTLNVHRALRETAHALLAHPALKQARIRTSAPTPLEPALSAQLREKLGPEALVRF
ncbi:MAG: hypothetical protein JNM17_23725 [Archangium sp.]|nr:hypothetical protein [Archangium sp.]